MFPPLGLSWMHFFHIYSLHVDFSRFTNLLNVALLDRPSLATLSEIALRLVTLYPFTLLFYLLAPCGTSHQLAHYRFVYLFTISFLPLEVNFLRTGALFVLWYSHTQKSVSLMVRLKKYLGMSSWIKAIFNVFLPPYMSELLIFLIGPKPNSSFLIYYFFY